MLVNVDLILHAWLRIRGLFLGRTIIAEPELRQLCQQFLPLLTDTIWLAGLGALVRNKLLYRSSTGFSLHPVAEPQRFTPLVDPAWQELWHALQSQLVLPMGCLWSTHWLQKHLPLHQPLLVVEVHRNELKHAAQIVRTEFGYKLCCFDQPSAPTSQPLLLLRACLPASRRTIVRGVRIASLEKVLVDLPEVLGWSSDTANWQMQQLLQQARAQFTLLPEQLVGYARLRGHDKYWQHLLRTTDMEL